MPFENLRAVHQIEAPGIIKPGIPKESKVAILGESVLFKHQPENPTHIEMMHRLDKESAEAGLLDNTGKPEILSDEEFDKWNHAGNTPQNSWRQIDLIKEADVPIEQSSGFINSYKPEKGVKNKITRRLNSQRRLERNRVQVHPKAKIDEIEWHTSQNIKHLEEHAVLQHMSDRFKQGTDMIIHWVDLDPQYTTKEDLQMLKRLGFSQLYTDRYEGEDTPSVCFVVDRSSFARAMLQRMSAQRS